MNLECASIKTKIIILENIFMNLSQQEPKDPYLYQLNKEGISDVLYKLDKLDNKYYNLCKKIDKNFKK